jgi:hypothetical protein
MRRDGCFTPTQKLPETLKVLKKKEVDEKALKVQVCDARMFNRRTNGGSKKNKTRTAG